MNVIQQVAGVAILVTGTLLSVAGAAVWGVFFRPVRLSYSKYIYYTLVRSAIYYQRLQGTPVVTSLDVYHRFIKESNSVANVVPLQYGAAGLWIGSPRASKVILYCHGGAYIRPATIGHFRMLQGLVDLASKQEKACSVFAITYDLAPKARYPHQLRQAREAFLYLINEMNVDFGNIIIAGDSAGAHLALSLVSHLAHPHQDVASIDCKGQRLQGMFLISPWIAFAQDTPSWESNAGIDYADKNLKMASDAFLGNSKPDPYNEPSTAAPEWWQDLPVKDICILAGEFEVMKSDIEALAQSMKVHNPQTQLVVASQEVHVESVVNRVFRAPRAQSEEVLRNWVMKQLT